jgi:hypothetical protein
MTDITEQLAEALDTIKHVTTVYGHNAGSWHMIREDATKALAVYEASKHKADCPKATRAQGQDIEGLVNALIGPAVAAYERVCPRCDYQAMRAALLAVQQKLRGGE